jgi:hypothetical protein
MPENTETASSQPKPAMPTKPIDSEQLTSLLRQTLFTDDEKQPAQAETETETEVEEEGEVEDTEQESEMEDSETESETESDEAEEADEEDETDEEPAKDSSKLPKGVQKRIDKLTAQKKEAEKQLKELSERLGELEANNTPGETKVVPVGQGLNPYFQLQSEQEIQAEIKNARQVRRWAEENPDGAIVTGKDGNEIEYSAEEVRRIKLNAIDALEEQLPAQLNYVANRRQFDAEAEKAYPFLKQRTSPEYQYAAELIRAFPEIQKFPDFKLSIGDMIEGRKLREGKSKKAAPMVKKAPANPRAASAPTQVNPKNLASKNAKANFIKRPDEHNLKQIVLDQFL